MTISNPLSNTGRQETLRESRKQISIFIPLSDWKAIRHEAARQHIPMTELCRRWIKPGLQKMQREQR